MRSKSRVQICVESEKFILAFASSDEAPSFGFGIMILSIKSQIMPFLLQFTSAINHTSWHYKRENFSFNLVIHDSSSDKAQITIIRQSFKLSCLLLSWSVQTAFFISLSLISIPIIFSLVTDIAQYFPFIQSTGLSVKIRIFLASSFLH